MIQTHCSLGSRKWLSIILALVACHANGQPSEIPPKRGHHALVYDEQLQKVIMTNGSTPVNGGQSFMVFNDVWSFEGKKWSNNGNAGDERSSVSFAYDSKEKKVMSMYGFSSIGKPMSDLRKFDKNQWTTISSNPDLELAEGGFVYDKSHDNFIAFGGSHEDRTLSIDTWIWDRKIWKKLSIASPPARQAFAMIYDSKRNRTVIFGGMGATPETLYGDTWEFDGKGWTKVSDSGPGARMAMGYAFDSKSGEMIIFGGAGKDGIKGDTWAWNGNAWRQLSTTGPQQRMMGYMAYDKKRDKVLLFGGRLGWPNDANDTWEWDGNLWTEVR